MAASDRREQEENGIKRFDPRILDRSVIAIPLLEEINKDDNEVHSVIIDVNIDYDEGREAGRTWIRESIKSAIAEIAPADEKQGVREKKTDISNQYIFARLSGKVIRELVRLDVERAATQAKKAEETAAVEETRKSLSAVSYSGTVPLSRHLPYLARFQDFTMHYQVARYGESRCGANFVLRARH